MKRCRQPPKASSPGSRGSLPISIISRPPCRLSEEIREIGVLEDVSLGGVSISLNIPIPVGTGARIHTRDFEGQVAIRYCELGDYGYLVGVEFADGYRWDEGKWEPAHLLAVPDGEW